MAESDDDYDTVAINNTNKRHGSQSGRNKFRKEREDSTINASMNERSSKPVMSTFNRDALKHRYNGNKRSEQSYSPQPPRLSSPRRSNGYQEQHAYNNSYYNSTRHDYGSLNKKYEENGFGYNKRQRSSYEAPGYYNSNFPTDNAHYDSSNKKQRRDWSVLEGPSHTKYYEHDNRSGTQDIDDLSDELLPQEYNRPNRPSNYSTYSKFDPDYHHNSNHNQYYSTYNNNMPFNNQSMANPMMMGNGFRNQQLYAGTFNNNVPYMQQNMFAMQQPALFNHLNTFNSDYDGQTQPQMLPFKQFLASLQAENNDIPISQEAATKRYNDYKNAFRREQIGLFYAVHKNEDWFRCRYHPDDAAKRKDEQREAIKRRLNIFLGLIDKYCACDNGFDLSLDMTNEKDRQNLFKFIDACIIKLEDGTDCDLNILEKIYTTSDAKTDISDNKIEIKTEEETMRTDQIDKHKVSDDESGMGSNDNSDDEEEEEEEEDDTLKSVDSKFDRKKKSKRKKNSPIVQEGTIKEETKPEETESTQLDSKNESEPKLEETVIITTTNQSDEKKTITIPHKTQSIFFKHLPVSVTRQDLEEIGKKFPGFKRASISEPAPERRFQRRGWITYDSSVDIKDVCSKINGLKLQEMLLNATINREIDQKIKCIIGLTNDKAIVRNDLKLITKVVDNMDKRWGLWQYIDTYTNNKLNDEDFKLQCDNKKKLKESNRKKSLESLDKPNDPLIEEDSKSDTNNELESNTTPIQNSETINETTTVLTKNPLIEQANDYLKYLSELRTDETELKETTNGNGIISHVKDEENKESEIKEETAEPKSNTITLNKTFKLEKDEKAAKLLDKLIVYLRIVHSIDYYNVTEYQQEDWMPNRCGILHARGSTEPKSTQQIVSILNGMNINHFEPLALKKVQIDEWLRLFEISVKSYVEYRERIDLEIARRLGLKDLNNEIEKFISSNCQKVEKDIWLCPLSGKKFKGPDYVRKHIESKHRERLLELRKDVEYFNRFVLDPKRPYLPEHPLTKNMTMMNSQQNLILYPDYYRSNMYPGMLNAPFNQYQNSSPYVNQNAFDSQAKNNYNPMYNQYQQHHSSNYSSMGQKPRR